MLKSWVTDNWKSLGKYQDEGRNYVEEGGSFTECEKLENPVKAPDSSLPTGIMICF